MAINYRSRPERARDLVAAIRADGRAVDANLRGFEAGLSYAGPTKQSPASLPPETRAIVDEGVRIDGRGPRDLRPVSAEVRVLPSAHGSGLFQRGETQVMNVTTLAMPRMNQMLDTLGPEGLRRSVVVAATSDQPPMVRVKGAFVATAIAEYYRDQGLNVVLYGKQQG